MDEIEAATIALQRTVEAVVNGVHSRPRSRRADDVILTDDEFSALSGALADVHEAAERAAFNEAPLVPGAHEHVSVTTPDGHGAFCRICRATLA